MYNLLILIAIIIGIYTIASSYLFEKGNGIPNTDSEIANRILSIVTNVILSIKFYIQWSIKSMYKQVSCQTR